MRVCVIKIEVCGLETVPSGGSLKKPDLPKMGDYFNVNIPFAVNPWNFFVSLACWVYFFFSVVCGRCNLWILSMNSRH